MTLPALTCFKFRFVSSPLRADAAFVAVAEIIHDIDLKDNRYQRPETAGLARLIDGLCSQTPTDQSRLERGILIFESLYRSFR
jgi:hypothetical protein